MTISVDLAVIGGGPAGSVLATLCAQKGFDVALYERERDPRYRVGESLLPATPRGILPLVGAADAIARTGFVVKPGATFHWGARPDAAWNLFFGGPDPSANAPTALNVDRQRFDAILLDNAASLGVVVNRGHAVTSVGDGDAVHGRLVEVNDLANGATHQVRARYVANASGQMRLKIPELEARTWSRFFRKVAIWSYWDNAGRLEVPLQGNVIFETLDTPHGTAWVWFIPISSTRTSIGVVAPRDCAASLRKDSRAGLGSLLATCPQVSRLLAGARQTTEPPYDKVRMHADYSYASDAFWAPGLVQVGDAACFADVLLSSGVHLATYGALLASRSIEAVLSGRLSETLAMNEYESRARQEYAVFYAGLTGLYDTGQLGDHYSSLLRNLLRHSNGVLIEWDQRNGATGGLNAELASAPELSPESEAARNTKIMRAYNLRQLSQEGPARIVPLSELPIIRNILAPSADAREWRLPENSAICNTGEVPSVQSRKSTNMLR